MSKFIKNFMLLVSIFPMIALATNGDNMIGFGAISRSMGGTGIANGMGAESSLKNPALLTTGEKEYEFHFAGTYFSPKVSARRTSSVYTQATEQTSSSDTFMIPSIGLAYKIGEDLFFGLGAYGTSGLGVDYRGANNIQAGADDGLFRMGTSVNLMKFVPSLTYKMDNFSIGASIAIQWGSLGITYDRGVHSDNNGDGDTGDAGLDGAVGQEGGGTSDDLGLGFGLGVAYIMNDFTFGANYQSSIDMEYKYQLGPAASDFGISNLATLNNLEQPAEIGVGVGYKINAWTITVDFKQVQWAEAKGYKDFGWENQNVVAAGFQYLLNEGKTKIRFGYNHAATPLGENAINSTQYNLNMFNILGFPATSESHYSLGVGHDFSDKFTLDSTLVISPETSMAGDTYAVTNPNTGAGVNDTITSKHAETSVTVSGRWSF